MHRNSSLFIEPPQIKSFEEAYMRSTSFANFDCLQTPFHFSNASINVSHTVPCMRCPARNYSSLTRPRPRRQIHKRTVSGAMTPTTLATLSEYILPKIMAAVWTPQTPRIRATVSGSNSFKMHVTFHIAYRDVSQCDIIFSMS